MVILEFLIKPILITFVTQLRNLALSKVELTFYSSWQLVFLFSDWQSEQEGTFSHGKVGVTPFAPLQIFNVSQQDLLKRSSSPCSRRHLHRYPVSTCEGLFPASAVSLVCLSLCQCNTVLRKLGFQSSTIGKFFRSIVGCSFSVLESFGFLHFYTFQKFF